MLASALALLLLAADSPPMAVVVAPREFLPHLEPLLAHRRVQGYRWLHVPNSLSAEEIRSKIRQAAAGGRLQAVLLVGDADPAAARDVRVRARTVPTRLIPAKVNVHFGSEREIASDNWYADLDDDDLPDLAIGRLPADSPQEVTRIVAKILAYETSVDHGLWRQRINFVAGVGGFGAITDSVIETATKKLLTDGVPANYQTSMTFGSWRSPFCPDPRQFHHTALARHNEGCLFWVYIGHGHSTQLDRIAVPGGQFHIFNCDDCIKLKAERTPPVAIMLACYTAAFDRPEDCLAEEMLRAPGGPVAVYGGSRVTMPYAMAVMGSEMLSEYFGNRPETLGEVIKNAKRRMALPVDEGSDRKDTNRVLLDGIASVISPARNMLEEERREHLHLFQLLGDPLLRLSYPQEVKIETAAEALPGAVLNVSCQSPLGGQLVLELVCRRDVFKGEMPTRQQFNPSHASLTRFQETYLQANDRVWSRKIVELNRISRNDPDAGFSVHGTLDVPALARGAAHVRAYVEGERGYASGAANLRIQPLPSAEIGR